MRKISAHFIFPINHPPIKHGIVIVNDDGIITEIKENPEQKELSGVEFFNGVLVPGFVNAHCHLELSGMKGNTTKNAGLTCFISEINKYRRNNTAINSKSITMADHEMLQNGIVAVGDIINTEDSIDVKSKSRIRYHNFIEIFGLDELKNDQKIYNAKCLAGQIRHNVSITPHSFYSINVNLINAIFEMCVGNKWPVSIHNQESPDEIQLFNEKRGVLYDFLIRDKNGKALWDQEKLDFYHEIPALKRYEHPVLMVHNTFTQGADVDRINDNIKKLFWIICPKSNLYIENQLPDLNLLINKNQVLAIGTDSLASNDCLNIFSEVQLILKNFKSISFMKILEWATLNGAKALKMDKELGSIETGKQPGINLIEKFDFINFSPSPESNVKKIV